VCCDTLCDGPNLSCNLTGMRGVCSMSAAQTPAMSGWGLLATALLLLIAGTATLVRRDSHR
jgi:hypothetical protein